MSISTNSYYADISPVKKKAFNHRPGTNAFVAVRALRPIDVAPVHNTNARTPLPRMRCCKLFEEADEEGRVRCRYALFLASLCDGQRGHHSRAAPGVGRARAVIDVWRSMSGLRLSIAKDDPPR